VRCCSAGTIVRGQFNRRVIDIAAVAEYTPDQGNKDYVQGDVPTGLFRCFR